MNKEYYDLLSLCREGTLLDIKNFPNILSYLNEIFDESGNKVKPPLVVSIVNNKKDISDYLISIGANVNESYKSSENYIINIINEVIESESDSFYVFEGKEYPEIIETESLEYILGKGVEVNKEDGRGYTALDYCIEYNHYSGAKLVVNNGGKHSKVFLNKVIKNMINNKNKEGVFKIYPHLKDLKDNDCIDTINRLKVKKHYRYHYELDRIMRETKKYDLKSYLGFLKNIIRDKIDINEKNEYGKTPVDYAIELGHTDAVNFLRENGGKTSEELEDESKS